MRHYHFPKYFFRIVTACWAILQKFLKRKSQSRCFQLSTNLFKDFFRSLWYCDKKQIIECGLAWNWWNSTDLEFIDMFLINLNAEIVACILSFRKSRHKPNLENTSKYGFYVFFFLRGWGGGGMAAFLACACKLSCPDASFARPGSALIWGRKKGEFRDWTRLWETWHTPRKNWPKYNAAPGVRYVSSCQITVFIFSETLKADKDYVKLYTSSFFHSTHFWRSSSHSLVTGVPNSWFEELIK